MGPAFWSFCCHFYDTNTYPFFEAQFEVSPSRKPPMVSIT